MCLFPQAAVHGRVPACCSALPLLQHAWAAACSPPFRHERRPLCKGMLRAWQRSVWVMGHKGVVSVTVVRAQIGRMGAVALARSVKGSKGLQHLELDDNQISEDGVTHVQARDFITCCCAWMSVHACRAAGAGHACLQRAG